MCVGGGAVGGALADRVKQWDRVWLDRGGQSGAGVEGEED